MFMNFVLATFKNQTRLLYSNEAEILTKTIQEMDTNELRPMLNELFPPVSKKKLAFE